MVTHCVDIIVDRNQLAVVKPVSDQYLYQRLIFRNEGLKMLTFSSHAMAREDPDINRRAEVIRILRAQKPRKPAPKKPEPAADSAGDSPAPAERKTETKAKASGKRKRKK